MIFHCFRYTLISFGTFTLWSLEKRHPACEIAAVISRCCGQLLNNSEKVIWLEQKVKLIVVIHTYIQIYVAPKIVRTNLRHWAQQDCDLPAFDRRLFTFLFYETKQGLTFLNSLAMIFCTKTWCFIIYICAVVCRGKVSVKLEWAPDVEMHSDCLQGIWVYCISAQRILPRLFLCSALSKDKMYYQDVNKSCFSCYHFECCLHSSVTSYSWIR